MKQWTRAYPIYTFLLMCFIFVAPAFAQEPIAPPSSPAEVCVSGIEEDSATVSWSPAPTATQYTVWVDGYRWTGSTGPAAKLEGLQAYTEYSVYVTAANDIGESGPSSLVTFKTLPPVPGVLEAPAVSEVTEGTAIVKWQPLPAWQYIQKYRIYVDGKPVADVDPQEGIQAANLTNLAAGKHMVAVSGINENCEGEPSQAVSFATQTVPSPSGLVMTNRSADTIWFMWDPVYDAEKYSVFLDGQPVGETHETAYNLDELNPDGQYEIGVKAVLPDGNISSAATIQVKTLSVTEQLNMASIMGAGSEYFPDVLPGIIVIFAIGGAMTIARMGQY